MVGFYWVSGTRLVPIISLITSPIVILNTSKIRGWRHAGEREVENVVKKRHLRAWIYFCCFFTTLSLFLVLAHPPILAVLRIISRVTTRVTIGANLFSDFIFTPLALPPYPFNFFGLNRVLASLTRARCLSICPMRSITPVRHARVRPLSSDILRH